MPVTSVEKNPEALTMTIVADFSAPVTRLWDAYVDPRQIEKFWGPPQYPATFFRHEVFPGGRSQYIMTGPEGEMHGGYWEFLNVDEGRSFEVLDGFAGEDGQPNPDMPAMRMVFSFEETGEGSRLTTTTYFNSAEELEQLLEMGMAEGTKAAMSQIDDVLADLRSFAAGQVTEAQMLSPTTIRVSRVIRGSVQQVWDAHHDPELLRQWQLGPEGWVMTEVSVGNAPGESYRYAWAPQDGVEGEPFAIYGEVKEATPPYREVFTETMEGIPGEPALDEMTLTPVEGGTLLSLVIAYDSQETRDAVLATGMTDGMESSYTRLEEKVLATA